MITPADSAPQAPGQLPASSFDIQAPYAAGSPDPILTGGDADPGGRDDVAGDVAAAQAAAEARYGEHQADTHAQGSTIGDVMDLPAETSTGSGGGGFYDPPRDYGG
jgi:hypothetical protein